MKHQMKLVSTREYNSTLKAKQALDQVLQSFLIDTLCHHFRERVIIEHTRLVAKLEAMDAAKLVAPDLGVSSDLREAILRYLRNQK